MSTTTRTPWPLIALIVVLVLVLPALAVYVVHHAASVTP